MTNAEQISLNELRKLVTDLRDSNRQFREEIDMRLKATEGKVDQKHLPISLEEDLVKSVIKSMNTAFDAAMSGYNSPLQKYALNVVAKYQTSIESVFDEVVKEAIKTDEFKARVREVLLHKIAKTMISGIDGSVDKTINQMKQDAVFRSRLTLAVNTIIDEFLKK